jgi:hypothetical protein
MIDYSLHITNLLWLTSWNFASGAIPNSKHHFNPIVNYCALALMVEPVSELGFTGSVASTGTLILRKYFVIAQTWIRF